MKTNSLTLNGLVAVVAIASFAGAFWSATVCRKYVNAANNGQVIQMVDRMQEQKQLASVLSQLRGGNVGAATNILTRRISEDAEAIQAFREAIGEDSEPLAADSAEKLLVITHADH